MPSQMCVLKDFGPNKFQNLILSEILENEDICGEDMQSQCNASVSRKKKSRIGKCCSGKSFWC